MKVFILLLGTAAIVSGRPQNPAEATIVKYDFNNVGPGYSYSWETSDGTKRDETAEVRNEGQENEFIAVRGSFSYLGPDGVVYTVRYIADENGFQPEGDHIQKPNIPAGVSDGDSGAPPALGFPSSALASLAGGGIG